MPFPVSRVHKRYRDRFRAFQSEEDPPFIVLLVSVNQRILEQIGRDLGKGAGETVNLDIIGAGDLDRELRFFVLVLQAEQHVVQVLLEIEHPPVIAGLVHGDLLEAGDQFGGAGQVRHGDDERFIGGLKEFVQHGALHGPGLVFGLQCP